MLVVLLVELLDRDHQRLRGVHHPQALVCFVRIRVRPDGLTP
jgi:hypothetical protein